MAAGSPRLGRSRRILTPSGRPSGEWSTGAEDAKPALYKCQESRRGASPRTSKAIGASTHTARRQVRNLRQRPNGGLSVVELCCSHQQRNPWAALVTREQVTETATTLRAMMTVKPAWSSYGAPRPSALETQVQAVNAKDAVAKTAAANAFGGNDPDRGRAHLQAEILATNNKVAANRTRNRPPACVSTHLLRQKGSQRHHHHDSPSRPSGLGCSPAG